MSDKSFRLFAVTILGKQEELQVLVGFPKDQKKLRQDAGLPFDPNKKYFTFLGGQVTPRDNTRDEIGKELGDLVWDQTGSGCTIHPLDDPQKVTDEVYFMLVVINGTPHSDKKTIKEHRWLPLYQLKRGELYRPIDEQNRLVVDAVEKYVKRL